MPGTEPGPDLILSADPSWPALGDEFWRDCEDAGIGSQVIVGKAAHQVSEVTFLSRLGELRSLPGLSANNDPLFWGVEAVGTRPVALACSAGSIRWIGLDAGRWIHEKSFHAGDDQAEALTLGVVKTGLYEAMDEVESVYLSQSSDFASADFRFQSRGDCLRAVAAYGRSLELALSVAGWSAPTKDENGVLLEFDLQNSTAETAVEEHAFVAHELRRRGVRLGAFAPALDWQRVEAGESEALKLLDGHGAVCKTFGHRFLLRQGTWEDAEIAATLGRIGCQAILRTTGIGIADALALLAERDAGLYNKCLECIRSLMESSGLRGELIDVLDFELPGLRPFQDAMLLLAQCGAGPFQRTGAGAKLNEMLAMAGRNSESMARRRFRSLIHRFGG